MNIYFKTIIASGQSAMFLANYNSKYLNFLKVQNINELSKLNNLSLAKSNPSSSICGDLYTASV